MKEDGIKSIWHEINANNKTLRNTKINVKDIHKLNHSNLISKILYDQGLKVALYSIFLGIFMGLMLYAMIYLNISFSATSMVIFLVAGSFIFFKLTSEISRYIFLKTTGSSASVKVSLIRLSKRLKKIQTFDLISNIAYYSILSFITLFIYYSERSGHYLWGNDFLPFIIAICAFLFTAPWLIKYFENRRYKSLQQNLNHSIDFLNEESKE